MALLREACEKRLLVSALRVRVAMRRRDKGRRVHQAKDALAGIEAKVKSPAVNLHEGALAGAPDEVVRELAETAARIIAQLSELADRIARARVGPDPHTKNP